MTTINREVLVDISVEESASLTTRVATLTNIVIEAKKSGSLGWHGKTIKGLIKLIANNSTALDILKEQQK